MKLQPLNPQQNSDYQTDLQTGVALSNSALRLCLHFERETYPEISKYNFTNIVILFGTFATEIHKESFRCQQ